jgi:hypothetical protein
VQAEAFDDLLMLMSGSLYDEREYSVLRCG